MQLNFVVFGAKSVKSEQVIVSKSVEETDEPIKSCMSKQQSLLLTDNLILFLAYVINCSDQATEKRK